MNIQSLKVLRTIAKVVLLIIVLGVVGYGGLVVYKSVINRPQKVRVTNVTDSAATITWVTDSPAKGVVYYKEEGSFLPGPLGVLGSKTAYDDRDFANAQKECVDSFNEKAKNTKDANFSVDVSNFDCENIPVKKVGTYYVHSVTVKNLKESSTYTFVVSNGVWSWKVSPTTISTFSNLEKVETPLPIFGSVRGDDDSYSNDALVYVTFTLIGKGEKRELIKSIEYSSVTNAEGGWYVDAAAIRDEKGDILPLGLGNDIFEMRAIYGNYGESEIEKHVFGFFDVSTFDIVVRKSSEIKTSMNKFIFDSYGASIDSNFIYWAQSRPAQSPYLKEDTCNLLPGWLCDYKDTKLTDELCYGEIGPGNCLKLLRRDLGETGNNLNLGNLQQNVDLNNKNSLNLFMKEIEYISGQQKVTIIYPGQTSPVEVNVGGGKVPDPEELRFCTAKDCSAPLDESSKCTIEATYSDTLFGQLHNCSIRCDSNQKISPSNTDCRDFSLFPKLNPILVKSSVDVEKKDGNRVTYSMDIYPIKLEVEDRRWLADISLEYRLYIIRKTVILNAEVSSGSKRNSNIKELEENCDILHYKYDTNTNTCILNLPPPPPPSSILSPELQRYDVNFVSKVYAEESTDQNSILFLPEYGMYSFELGNYELKKETTDGKTLYLFYIETNGKPGFQMPKDPDNPTEEEDIVLKSSSGVINYSKVSSAQTYSIQKGINIISFNILPLSTELKPLKASGVIEEAKKKGVIIRDITSFEGGRWSKGYTCSAEDCKGNDFTIIPGKGYLVYAIEGGDMSIGGYELKSPIPVNLSKGWNLIGVHGYRNAYTAASLIESINKIKGLTANNVTWWPTSKGMYEGLQVTDNQQYGFDFPISPTNGYFVRISSFKPEDTKCKTLLWNEGGEFNGLCGITK